MRLRNEVDDEVEMMASMSRQQVLFAAIPVVIGAVLVTVVGRTVIESPQGLADPRYCVEIAQSAPASEVSQTGKVRVGAEADAAIEPNSGGRARSTLGDSKSGDQPVNYVRCRSSNP